MDLKKVPAISETIDWARTLLLLHTESLDPQLVRDTLNVILKFQEDIENVDAEISTLTSKPVAEVTQLRWIAPSPTSSARFATPRCASPPPRRSMRSTRSSWCGYEDREFLRRTLSLVLPKTADEKETFENCFDQFFSFEDVRGERHEGGSPDGADGRAGR